MKISHNVYIVLLVSCQLIGLATYLQGFFPLKKVVEGKANLENLPSEPGVDGNGEPLPKKFDRLVIVLVDALRADFVFSGNHRMPYTQGLIENNETISILAKAHPPTVTMPRIKAMTSGGVPGFIDIVFNANSKAFLEDNLITQMAQSHKKLVFYGDDTWLKLFPDHFSRMDGTTSFFVTDYTEVDNNVTRHISTELQKKDWDVLILHYLGLDHIGHTAGPSSPLVGPKLLEMDQVIEQIHRNILKWDRDRQVPSLLVLCGDHGMSDAGSHGGASAAEVFTPLVLMSSLFQDRQGSEVSSQQVQQIDIVPTLALLLGLPIPQNSIGTVILETFKFHEPRHKLRALQLNALQVSKVLQANGHSTHHIWELEQANKLHSEWIKANVDDPKTAESAEAWAEKIAKLYATALQKMSGRVAASLSSYDLHALAVGIAILLQTFVWCTWGLMAQRTGVSSGSLQSVTGGFVTGGAVLIVMVIHLSVCSGTRTGASEILCSTTPQAVLLCTTFVLLTASTLATAVLSIFKEHSFLRITLLSGWSFSRFWSHSNTGKFLCSGTALHAISLLSSSFVEEEHQTWYFLTTAYFLLVPFDMVNGQRIYKSSKVITLKRENPRNIDLRDNLKQRSLQGRVQCTVGRAHEQFKDGVAEPHEVVRQEAATQREEVVEKVDLREFLPGLAASVVLLILARLSRAWNQTGIKWADRPDIGDWLLHPSNQKTLSLTAAMSMLVIWMLRRGRHNSFSSFVLLVGSMGVYHYRGVTGTLWLPWEWRITKGMDEARFVYFCVSASLLWSAACFFIAYTWEAWISHPFPVRKYHFDVVENFLSALLLLDMLLLRPHNIVLLAVFVVQEHVLSRYVWPRHIEEPWLVVLGGLWMGHAAYFAQGNSNSLASVDLAAGYIGLKDHISSLVLPLLCMTTYCGPILWFTSVALFFVRHSFNVERLCLSVHQMCYVRLLCQALLLSVYTVLVFIQRFHLFVWSVFSPKLLYELMATIMLSLCVMFTVGLLHLIARGVWSVDRPWRESGNEELGKRITETCPFTKDLQQIGPNPCNLT